MIGVDFDNTIVSYDSLFRKVAVESGLVPSAAATSKTALRDALRASGREDSWTLLQGIVYGPRMMEAELFPGVLDFLRACQAAGLPVAIISHRSRVPYLGERHDLHAAARNWLLHHRFHAGDRPLVPEQSVFFEETKEAKLERIAALGCTHFIDDLPEVLSHPLFPGNIRRILFDPHGGHHAIPGVTAAASWTVVTELLAPRSRASMAPLMSAVGLPPPLTITRLPGGGNNRVYRVETAVRPVVVKEYFRHPSDPRDRLGAEQAFSHFAWEHGVRALPQPLGCDRQAGLAAYEFITGRRISAAELGVTHIEAAIAFVAALNRCRHQPAARDLPVASEACFSIGDHLACVDRRVAHLGELGGDSPSHLRAARLIAGQVRPLWHTIRARALARAHAHGISVDTPLPPSGRVISPSDFGFHNCLVAGDGLRFLDFEYAGWDDPAKLACDFFCQPAVPIPRHYMHQFLDGVGEAVGAEDIQDRVDSLLPVYELKWCCIMLNEFLRTGRDRRAFARADERHEEQRMEQLDKVEAALARLA